MSGELIEFACPYCQQVTAVPVAMAGQEGRCPGCQQAIQVPDPAGQPTLPPQRLQGAAPPPTPVAPAGGDASRDCPFCGERILQAARKCRFCGEFLDGSRGGRRVATGERPPSHLALAIVTTLCCCQLFGVVAIIYAAQVDTRWNAGDAAGAHDASHKARLWSVLALAAGLIVGALYIGAAALG